MLGACDLALLYDAPHNYIWKQQIDGEDYYIHRKCSAVPAAAREMAGTAFAYYGEPVMIPGSMGSSSYSAARTGKPRCALQCKPRRRTAKSRGDAIKGKR